MPAVPPEALEDRSGVLLLRVRAIPGAGRTEVGGTRDGALVVRVSAPPEKGRANQALARAIATALGLPRSAVRLESGERSRTKCFRIEGIERDALAPRVTALLDRTRT